jgi:AraC-like DNA-binding protein
MTEKKLVKAAMRIVDNADAAELGKLSVNEIARRLIVNRSTLSRAFSSCFMYTSLRRYLELRRFHMFDYLLIFEEVETVKEALTILDIRDAGHFIKRYKAYRLLTPGESCRAYRRGRAEFQRKIESENRVFVTK